MKNLILLTSFLFLATQTVIANPIKAVKDSTWANSQTWDINRMPIEGDTVVIPTGKTVVMNSNEGKFNLVVLVYGTLKMKVGKLDLSTNSTIIVYEGGKISGSGSNSEFIQINNVTKFRGTNSDVIGPMYANSTTGNSFAPFATITLPVQFLSVSAAIKGQDVLIQWATSQEINADYFEVERSYNGSTWTIIGRTEAAGNSTAVLHYSFTDKNAQGTVHYRIKETATNGSVSYSAIRSVKINGNSDIIVRSQGGQVVLQFPKEIRGTVLVQVVSVSGQVVKVKNLNNPVGQVTIPVSASKGQYIITLGNGQHMHTAKQVLL